MLKQHFSSNHQVNAHGGGSAQKKQALGAKMDKEITLMSAIEPVPYSEKTVEALPPGGRQPELRFEQEEPSCDEMLLENVQAKEG